MTKKIKHKELRSHTKHFTVLCDKNPLWKIPRIRLQFLVTILLSFMLAVGGFSLTWHMMPCAWKIARHIPGMDLDRETLKTELTERAKNYDLPSSENNKQEQAAFNLFLTAWILTLASQFTVGLNVTFVHSIPPTSFTARTGTFLPT